jgi:glycosyltransferase involved in cell wall biosynthesis
VHCGITVIIPAYNSAPVLETAVRSVHAQAGFAAEIIVVDDGSTDDTPSVLRRMAADNLTVRTQTHAGPGAARNAGIQEARGEWIAFLDADDWWMPDKLELQMSTLDANPDHAFCYGDSIARDNRGAERVVRASGAKEDLFLDLLQGPAFATTTAVVRRGCFDRVGFFDTGLGSGEDWDMWLRLAAEFRGCYVPRPLCVYRLPDRGDKYSAEIMEKCTLRVIGRALSNPEARRRWPRMKGSRRRIYAWHYSVLAKTYLRQNKNASFLRLAARAMAWHPAGAVFLMRRWRHSTLPRLL